VIWPDFPLGFYPLAIAAILVTGISKGGFATGAAGIAVPLMSIYIAPAQAAGIMLPILCAMDLFGVHAWRGKGSRAHLAALVPGAIAGIALGGLAFGALSANAVRLVVGVIAVVFAMNQALALTQRIAARFARERPPPGRIAGAVWGALSGFTSTLAHAGGPPFAVYMLPQKIDRGTLVATSALFFLVVNYVKIVPYAMLGQLDFANLGTSLLFAPLAPLGIWLGVWMHRRISDAAFFRITWIVLFATGVKLVFDALAS
jgi:uncharacterized membrane protein YfcA